ncbi:MAG: ribonucleotide reductase N-terminal alpha domain-containing protein [Patescibacteria group bacterium]
MFVPKRAKINSVKDLELLAKDLNVDLTHAQNLISKHGISDTARIYGFDVTDYDNLIFGGRLLIYDLYNKCPRTIQEYTEILSHVLHPKIIEYMRRYETRLQKLMEENWINYLDCDFFAASTLIRTYLTKPHYSLDPTETPWFKDLRIATQLYMDVGIESVILCFKEMSSKLYTHSSPTIFNSGLKRPQLSSCFLATIEDDLRSILYDGVFNNGMIGSMAGGLGTDISRIRHSEIGSTGMSSGVMPMMLLYNSATKYINQQGRRNGAQTLYYRPHGLDVIDFIQAVRKDGDMSKRTNDINNALWIPDIFMKRVEKDERWTLFDPGRTPLIRDCYGEEYERNYEMYEREAERLDNEFKIIDEEYQNANKTLEQMDPQSDEYSVRRKLRTDILKRWTVASKNRIRFSAMKARDLFSIIIDTQRRTGLPSLLYEDACNFKSNQKNLGYIRCSNLCTEIIEFTSDKEIASCNLASISLSAFNNNFVVLGGTMRSVVRNLNRVIDTNWYPLDTYDESGRVINRGKISTTNFKNRPIGIGVSGFAEMIFQQGLGFDDPRVAMLNKKVFACLYFNGLISSVEEAIRHGPYESFRGSPLSEGKFQFDLWRDEYDRLSKTNPSQLEFRKREDDDPVDPREWGQLTFILENGVTIEPSWASLRSVIMKYGVRNSLLLCLMPTATSSQILRNTETCEPPESNLYTRRVMNGEFPVLNRFMVRDLKEIGAWNILTYEILKRDYGSLTNLKKAITEEYRDRYFNVDVEKLDKIISRYKTVWEISQKTLLKLMADRMRYICQSTSNNIFLAEPTDAQLQAVHMYTWKLGLKTGLYYLRMNISAKANQMTVNKQILDKVCSRDDKSCMSCQ